MQLAQKILIAEKDKSIRNSIRQSLEQGPYIVYESVSVKRTKEIIRNQTIDLLVMGFDLKDGSSIDLIPYIKNHHISLIMIDQTINESVVLKAFAKGADDFVNYPYQSAVISAKISAYLKSSVQKNGSVSLLDGAQQSGKSPRKFMQWVQDPNQCQLFNGDMSAHLTVQEYCLLDTLINHAGTTLKRQYLAESLREGCYIPSLRAIDVKIARIRQKIGDTDPDKHIIQTIRGIGYLFDSSYII
tara:strand:- start:429 stop:1157 length:729 start_codon:yes stop_codon:yes gene_type:complete